MFIATQGAAASTSAASISSTTPAPSPQPVTSPGPAIPLPPAPGSPSDSQRQHVRHLLLGTLGTVQATIRHLHKLGYAEPNDWSQPISTDRPNEVMAILTKRVVAQM